MSKIKVTLEIDEEIIERLEEDIDEMVVYDLSALVQSILLDYLCNV